MQGDVSVTIESVDSMHGQHIVVAPTVHT